MDNEGAVLIFEVKKFHQYLLGHRFTIVTDNMAIKIIFDPHRAVSVLAAAYITRWSLLLNQYDRVSCCLYFSVFSVFFCISCLSVFFLYLGDFFIIFCISPNFTLIFFFSEILMDLRFSVYAIIKNFACGEL